MIEGVVLVEKPTPAEIEAVLAVMSGDEVIPFDEEDLRWVTVFDPDGNWQSVGTGHSPWDAAASAWINMFVPAEECGMPSAMTCAMIPRHVPEGWIFQGDDLVS